MDRDELKRLCEAATPGPWEADDDPGSHAVHYVFGPDGDAVALVGGNLGIDAERVYYADEVAQFVAAARSAVPELLAEVERLQAERDECERLMWAARDETEKAQAERDKLRALAGEYMAAINACWPPDPITAEDHARLEAVETALRRALEGNDQ